MGKRESKNEETTEIQAFKRNVGAQVLKRRSVRKPISMACVEEKSVKLPEVIAPMVK